MERLQLPITLARTASMAVDRLVKTFQSSSLPLSRRRNDIDAVRRS